MPLPSKKALTVVVAQRTQYQHLYIVFWPLVGGRLRQAELFPLLTSLLWRRETVARNRCEKTVGRADRCGGAFLGSHGAGSICKSALRSGNSRIFGCGEMR